MSKKVLFVFLAVVVLLSACAPQATPLPPSPVPTTVEPTPTEVLPSPTPAPTEKTSLTVTDALGREVVLATPPTRIVLAGKALFMIADAVYLFPQASSRIVALGKTGQGSSNFIALIDPQFEAKVTLQQDAGAEQIAAVNPDLVIMKSSQASSLGKSVEAVGIPVIYVDFETPEQYTRDLEILGKVFDDEARAQQVAAFYQDKVNAIQSAVQEAASRPKVLMLYYTEKEGTVAFNVPPMNWMQTRMVEIAGGEPVWSSANPGNGWATVTLEQIAAWDADQIFIITYTKNASDVVAALKADAQWQALRAVKEGRLYAFPADLYSWDQPDVRWILGLTWLAGRLHPQQFPQLDMVQEARQFYQVLYGLNEQFFEEKIRSTFKGDVP
ncbi:ABC transporter substrate-binding protein [Anaerolinea sp.]|uniref:ABC transporter substrate-binding protein n=1 Tax=Anaerolinea sp. TaxID=1872519 RepID=UPI002ACE1926|nr:ABC transporter substrate-binding protein [Anaerolinea sp.]